MVSTSPWYILLLIRKSAEGSEVIEATKRIASMMQKDILGVGHLISEK